MKCYGAGFTTFEWIFRTIKSMRTTYRGLYVILLGPATRSAHAQLPRRSIDHALVVPEHVLLEKKLFIQWFVTEALEIKISNMLAYFKKTSAHLNDYNDSRFKKRSNSTPSTPGLITISGLVWVNSFRRYALGALHQKCIQESCWLSLQSSFGNIWALHTLY